MIRIISGIYKGKRLNKVRSSLVRPIPDKLKETLFNIIQEEVKGCVFLDGFAGTGSVGIEALSRGAEKEEIMKELHLKLFEENKIEGKMFIDLTGQEIPKVLQPQMTFYFAGKLQVEKAKVKLDIKKLFLEEQSIPVLVLDLIIYISSKIDGSEASSINDWYELPYGIKDLKTRPGKAIIFY